MERDKDFKKDKDIGIKKDKERQRKTKIMCSYSVSMCERECAVESQN